MQAVLEQNLIADSVLNWNGEESEKKIGTFTKLFGCWHQNLSRPFTHNGRSYRVCQNCGARKHFDPKSFKTYGPFYYPAGQSLRTIGFA